MNMFAKKLSITLLTAATALAPLTVTADAGDRRGDRQHFRNHAGADRFHNRRDHRQRIVRRHNDNGSAIALGIIGLGAAAIIGGAIANSNNQGVTYRQPAAPRPVSGGRYEPWSNSWFQYCSNKYRSFNASTGTYRGYDGRDHFCVVN